MIGPPAVPPKRFQRSFGVGWPCAVFEINGLFSHLFALKKSLRRNSNTSPWKPFVPDLMVALTMPPAWLPNSAEAFCVIRLNSPIASSEGEYQTRLSEA